MLSNISKLLQTFDRNTTPLLGRSEAGVFPTVLEGVLKQWWRSWFHAFGFSTFSGGLRDGAYAAFLVFEARAAGARGVSRNFCAHRLSRCGGFTKRIHEVFRGFRCFTKRTYDRG